MDWFHEWQKLPKLIWKDKANFNETTFTKKVKCVTKCSPANKISRSEILVTCMHADKHNNGGKLWGERACLGVGEGGDW